MLWRVVCMLSTYVCRVGVCVVCVFVSVSTTYYITMSALSCVDI